MGSMEKLSKPRTACMFDRRRVYEWRDLPDAAEDFESEAIETAGGLFRLLAPQRQAPDRAPC